MPLIYVGLKKMKLFSQLKFKEKSLFIFYHYNTKHTTNDLLTKVILRSAQGLGGSFLLFYSNLLTVFQLQELKKDCEPDCSSNQ